MMNRVSVVAVVALLALAQAAQASCAGRQVRARAAGRDAGLAAGNDAVVVSPEIMLSDPGGSRSLPILAVYPRQMSGQLPLVVFSHGAGGSGEGVLELPLHWAAHGYVVLVPTHADSIKNGKGMSFLKELKSRVEGTYADFLYRPADVTFLLDSLDTVVARVPELAGRIDMDRIGVGGHSLGSYTSQLIGGATVDVSASERDVNLGDKRVRALLLLSGQGAGQLGLTERSWSRIDLPMMSITGSKDLGAGNQSPSWRKDPYLKSPAGGKYFVFIEGAEHSSFTKEAGGAGHQTPGRSQKSPAGAQGEEGLSRVLGEREPRIAEMSRFERAMLMRRIEKLTEGLEKAGRGEGMRGKLDALAGQMRGEHWEAADGLRDELLDAEAAASATPQSGSEGDRSMFEWVEALTLDFWDAHLKQDASAVKILGSSDVTAPSGGLVTIESR